MKQKNWIAFQTSAEINAPPQVEVSKDSHHLVTRDMQDAGGRTTISVRYTPSGAWEGTLENYQRFEIPEATFVEQEGAPSVPKAGIFVAVPLDARNVEVSVAHKTTLAVDHEVSMLPAPKQFMEEEFRLVNEPDTAIYGSDDPYPGRDFDFLGLKTIAGIRVAHILVYLGQYRPLSKRMELTSSLTLDVSYVTPPATDRQPGRKPGVLPESNLILGLDLLDDHTDFSARSDSFDDHDPEFLGPDGDGGPWSGARRGLSHLTDPETNPNEPIFVGGPVTISSSTTATISPSVIATFVPVKLRLTGIISEYVIVTTPELQTAVAPLLAAKSGWPHFGRVALSTDIQTEFPAASLKESIKSFISWATANWRVPPRFVVFAGDTDVIPMHTYVESSGNSYASDHYYLDLSGDRVPELVVSRIPTSNSVVMKSICEHLARYSGFRDGDWGGWQNRVLMVAYAASTYETCCDEIADRISPRYTVLKRYAKNTTKADVVQAMNDGVLFAFYRGHGSQTEWSASNGLSTTDIAALTNSAAPAFVFNICCQNGWVDANTVETVTESFVRNRKAIAVFAASRNSWTYPNNDFAKYLFDAVMTGGCQTPAAIMRYAKTKMVQNHGTSNYHLENVVMYNLFGDPTADVASHAEWLRGNWGMDHDGWRGTLKVNRIWNYRVMMSGGFGAPVWSISGEYVGSDNKSYPFTGTLGGFDPNQLGPGSKRSDHKVEFVVDFSAANHQKFVGYVHTWTRDRLSGLTWWSNHPFGWTAIKTP